MRENEKIPEVAKGTKGKRPVKGNDYSFNPGQTFKEYDEVSDKEKLIAITTFLRTNSKKRTCNLCGITMDCMKKVIDEYFFIIQDVQNDNAISEKVHKELTHQVDMSLDISNKILELYYKQVNRISDAFKDGDKLINDYLMQQLSSIYNDVSGLIKLQIDLEEKHKSVFKNMIDQSSKLVYDNTQADVDYYMQNQWAVLEELEKKSPRIVLEDFQTHERKYYTSTLQISREYGVDEESFRVVLMRENNPYLECKDGRKFKLYYEGNDGAK